MKALVRDMNIHQLIKDKILLKAVVAAVQVDMYANVEAETVYIEYLTEYLNDVTWLAKITAECTKWIFDQTSETFKQMSWQQCK